LSAFIFSRGSAADAAELAEFAARTFAEAFSADNDPANLQAHLDAHYGAEQQAAELRDPLVRTILVRSNRALVAYAQVRQSPPPPCVSHAFPTELHRFYLHRQTHGSGLASSLMREVHRAASDFGGQHIWLGVWEQNPRAIAFYKKERFVDVGSQFYRVGPDRQVDRVLVAGVRPEFRGLSRVAREE